MTDRATITDETPLRISEAAAIAFPDGSMTESGLRLEISKGRLAFERIAGKDYTTLADIKRMRTICRVEARDRGYGSETSAAQQTAPSPIPPHGSLSTDDIRKARDAALLTVQELKERSPRSSAKSTSRKSRTADNVIRPKFRSPTR